MEERLSPNRMNLLNLRLQIAAAERGAGILDDKRAALVKELLSIYKEMITERNTLREAMQNAASELCYALGIEGKEGVISSAYAAKREVSIEVTERNVWGVRFPQIHHKIHNKTMIRRLDDRGYSFVTVSGTVDSTAKRFEVVLNALLETASSEAYMKRVGIEVRKTARRINALNELIIPVKKRQLQYISRALEEREREDILRLKKLKKM